MKWILGLLILFSCNHDKTEKQKSKSIGDQISKPAIKKQIEPVRKQKPKRAVVASPICKNLIMPSKQKTKVSFPSRALPSYKNYVNVKTQGKYGIITVRDLKNNRVLKIGDTVQGSQPIVPGPIAVMDPIVELIERYKYRGNRGLVIGLGTGFTSQELISRGYDVESVEIEPKVVSFARKYFGFSGRATVDDGLAYLEKSWKWFDFIIIDAFLGKKTPGHFFSRKALNLYRQKLFKKGIIAFRLIASPINPHYIETVKRLVSYLGKATAYGDKGGNKVQTIYLVFQPSSCSKSFIEMKRALPLVPLGTFTSKTKEVTLTGYLLKNNKGELLLSLPLNIMGDFTIKLSGENLNKIEKLVSSEDYYPSRGDVWEDGPQNNTLHKAGGGGEVPGSGVRTSHIMVKVSGSMGILPYPPGLFSWLKTSYNPHYNLRVSSVDGVLTFNQWSKFRESNKKLFFSLEKPEKENEETARDKTQNELKKRMVKSFGRWVKELHAYTRYGKGSRYHTLWNSESSLIYKKHHDSQPKLVNINFRIDELFNKLLKKDSTYQEQVWASRIISQLMINHKEIKKRVKILLRKTPTLIYSHPQLMFPLLSENTKLVKPDKSINKQVLQNFFKDQKKLLSRLPLGKIPYPKTLRSFHSILTKALVQRKLNVTIIPILFSSIKKEGYYNICINYGYFQSGKIINKPSKERLREYLLKNFSSFSSQIKIIALDLIFSTTLKIRFDKPAYTSHKKKLIPILKLSMNSKDTSLILATLKILPELDYVPLWMLKKLNSLFGCSLEFDILLSEMLSKYFYADDWIEGSGRNIKTGSLGGKSGELEALKIEKKVHSTIKIALLQGGKHHKKVISFMHFLGEGGKELTRYLKKDFIKSQWSEDYRRAMRVVGCIGINDPTLIPVLMTRLKRAYAGDALRILNAINTIKTEQLTWFLKKHNKWALILLEKWKKSEFGEMVRPYEPAEAILKKIEKVKKELKTE
jgi:SAM-dependent methyltransferase